jgi:hypothetical protein
MPAPVDQEKIWKIFQKAIETDISPGEFEELICDLGEDELLALRQLLVDARCTSIKLLAERGWPLMRAKPN